MKKFLIVLIVLMVLAMGKLAIAVDGDPVLEPVLITEIESTDLSGQDGTLITGTKGTDTYAAVWNADGDLVNGPGVPAITDLSNIASTAIPVSLISDTAGTDDLGSAAIFWQKLYLKSEIFFEGATDDANNTTFSVTDPTGTRTITVPDSNQTIGVATSAAADAIDAITEIASALKSGSDTTLITGTKGTSGNVGVWNADGDLVDGGAVTPGSFGAETAKTLATDVLDLSDGTNFAGVAGEGAAADDVAEIQAAAAGDIVVLSNPNAGSYTITVKDGTYMKLQADFALDGVDDTITLICSAVGANDTFREISRANN